MQGYMPQPANIGTKMSDFNAQEMGGSDLSMSKFEASWFGEHFW